MCSAPLARAARTPKRHRLRGGDGTEQISERPAHGWGETPDRAPLRMEARPFQTITWRDIMHPVAAWLRTRLAVTAGRLARARIDA